MLYFYKKTVISRCAIDKQRTDRDASQTRNLGRLPQTSPDDLTIIGRLVNALERLSNTQPNTTHGEVFKTLSFMGENNIESFIQQFQKVGYIK